MSKKVRYSDGYVGVVSDKVAEILAKKGAASVLGEAPKVTKKAAAEKAEADK